MTQQFNRITIKAKTWWTKPLNSSSGSSSFLMRAGTIPFKYEGKTNVKVSDLEEFLSINKELVLDDPDELRTKASEKKKDARIQANILKEELGVSRMIKGVRGALRHSTMKILYNRGIEYCSTSIKENFQGTGESTLLEGEHVMGKCGDTPCELRQIFGMFGEQSPIKVWSDVIVRVSDKVNIQKVKSQRGISFMYVSTENRHASRRDKKTIQDFSEQYFSGEFQFYVEFSKELPDWLLGMLVKGIFGITHLGRGENSGYGRMEIIDIGFEKVISERKLGKENGNGRRNVLQKETVVNLNDKLDKVMDAWQKYN